MATKTSDIVIQARQTLLETTARFWSEAELTGLAHLGYHDLWGAILDVHGEHYLQVCEEVVYPASGTQLIHVPVDCFRVQVIEPLTTSDDGSGPFVQFVPRKFNTPEFAAARSMTAADSNGTAIIYYAVSGVGAPLEAPIIRCAPKLSSDLTVRLAYNPTLTVGEFNPIPGESDHAIKAWIIAFARAKESEGRMPDAAWLSVYATEKQSILTRITPRQEQEPEYVTGLFEGWT